MPKAKTDKTKQKTVTTKAGQLMRPKVKEKIKAQLRSSKTGKKTTVAAAEKNPDAVEATTTLAERKKFEKQAAKQRDQPTNLHPHQSTTAEVEKEQREARRKVAAETFMPAMQPAEVVVHRFYEIETEDGERFFGELLESKGKTQTVEYWIDGKPFGQKDFHFAKQSVREIERTLAYERSFIAI